MVQQDAGRFHLPLSGSLARRRRIEENIRSCADAETQWDLHEADPAGVDAPLISRETLRETRQMLQEEWRRLHGEDRRRKYAGEPEPARPRDRPQ